MLSTLLTATVWLLSTTAVTSESSSIVVNEINRLSNQTLLWGPYNPSLYFGMRPRIPKSIFTGLIWNRLEDYQTAQKSFRHTCEQGDDMAGYGWQQYDVRRGGKQTIYDKGNDIDLEIDLVKVPGGNHGGNWGVRIRGIPRSNAPEDIKTSLYFYVGLEGEGSVDLVNEPDSKGLLGTVKLSGISPGLGDFTVEITTGPEDNKSPDMPDASLADEQFVSRTLYQSFLYPVEHLWRVKNILFMELKRRLDSIVERFGKDNLPPPWQALTLSNEHGQGNLHFTQKIFQGKFEFDILFSSGSAPKPMSSSILTETIDIVKSDFKENFDQIFPRITPFDETKYEKFAQDLFSNLLGGIGFFHGTSIVDKTEYKEDEENFWEEAKRNREKDLGQIEGPSTLFTSIPSRPFFPRGFLWDEGFHLLPIIEWDVDLALEIVKSWFSLIDQDGWIAREQILGEEARSKVPREFQTQYPHYANPPALFLVLTRFIEKLQDPDDQSRLHMINNGKQVSGIGIDNVSSAILETPEVSRQYLEEIYPLLRRYYHWFRETQTGEVRAYDRPAFSSKEAYRWRGRAPGYCLTSGIDDYPRAEPPHPGELHVDLISWMGFMSKSIRKIALALDETDDAKEYERHEKAIVQNIDDLHWNKDVKCYCDATVDKFEESVHVCHVGYVSIFPFLLGLLDKQSVKLGHLLDIIGDKDQLWSPFGLRSLSRKDAFYSTGENYWRGPIWINMNYLAILQLKAYGSQDGPYQQKAAELYTSLRKNVVANVFRVWKKTGFAWEQYEQESGNAKGVQHFLGWTSLVVNIMALPEKVEFIPQPEHAEL